MEKEIPKKIKEELIAANQQLKAIEEELRVHLSEAIKNREALDSTYQQLNSIIDFLPDATFVIDVEGKVTRWNRAMEELTGVKEKDILGKDKSHYTPLFYNNDTSLLINMVFMSPEERKKKFPYVKDYNGVLFAENFCPAIKGEGIYASARASILYDHNGNAIGAIETIRDISHLKQTEKALRESEEKYRNILESIEDGYFEVNIFGEFTFFNTALVKALGYSANELLGMNYKTVMDDINAQKTFSVFNRVFLTKKPIKEFEWEVIRKDKSKIFVETTVLPILSENEEVIGFRGLIRDISERKIAQEKLKHMSLHDSLTNLYNRFYFTEQMQYLDNKSITNVGLIVFDVDGLKFVNDTLGHDKGDLLLVTVAQILNNCFADYESVIARVGGDEFAVIVRNVSRTEIEYLMKRFKQSLKEYNENQEDLIISVSGGCSFRANEPISMEEMFKEADNNMYREKLLSRQSNRSTIVKTLMKALEARDFITEGHTDRLQVLVEKMAKKLGLSDRSVNDLCLFARFHDIGKVGISDTILFKKGKLTPQEFSEMKRHSEIGHRIALASPDLVIISDWILKHHEWWNGEGYPLNLIGEEIPLECRILAIADAYDAMTSYRPYRNALSKKEALKEIKKNAGIQFDPTLVDIFIDIIEEEISSGN